MRAMAWEGRDRLDGCEQRCTRAMPVYAGIGALRKYLGKIQCDDGFAKPVTDCGLIAQLCRKQAQGGCSSLSHRTVRPVPARRCR
ncbi:hypothetical protein XAC3810_530006 [Xanthomonas citri pv. citri]|uniref:Uncharacterized protein n=1 Tax=Xanthomonas citri pv. citri TaxID=611301 RepID=A0A0U5BV75_XANCI|nr:hypothetical protein XAC9322_530005 [Xanthomonas citri pv. citri]CEE31453.1 hypothetical protein XAC3824_670006 [Xanthomonas citri pv. citri]CEE32809.1 hypothetical protein XAC1083_520006 [Xanthomonas citri pv. citri]CEE42307.1 hypothetical protein XAC3810_530006 [Xanthomonas citri pv. citri]CEE44180.1 hypothetical protein XAC902_690006 [Xanthomonas citri pv. citri]